MNKTTIYFIRHAESPFIFGAERERPLSDKGFDDSRKVAETLANIQFDQFFSSSYTRAIQTLEPLANHSEIIIYDELREKRLKGPYKLEKAEIDEAIKQSFIDIDFNLYGGESTIDAQKRSIPIIIEILNNDSLHIVAIGTHGNILTAILNYFDSSIGFDFWKNTSKPDIYKIEFNNQSLHTIERIGFES
ncbi:histidine phosphatase family protein [Macrococcus animalis]|uniref:histidine phosphatase family protein n=1 Tax=Macrococcus animalis TaxID=3395467 RepID=UPI0039BE508F